MRKLLGFALAAGITATAAPAAAGDVKLTIANGRVTLIAHDATVREILAEWARVGHTRIVNGEKLVGAPVTLQLENVPEEKALDTLLRSAAGYILAPRAASTPGPSTYDRIMILASSRPPANVPGPSPLNNNRAFAAPRATPVMPNPIEPDDDDEDDDEPEVAPPPQGVPVPPTPGAQPFPGTPGQETPAQQAPMTAPRPGMLPQPVQPPVPGASPNPMANPGVNAPVIPGAPPVRPGPGGGDDER